MNKPDLVKVFVYIILGLAWTFINASLVEIAVKRAFMDKEVLRARQMTAEMDSLMQQFRGE